MGIGWGAKLYTRLFVEDYFQLYLSSHNFHIQSLSGGDGLEIVSISNAGIFIPTVYDVNFGVEWFFYRRFGVYKELPDIRGKHSSIQAFISYSL
jgi:hypothetical protein